MNRSNISMIVIGKDYDKETVIRINDGDSFACSSLNKEETLLMFNEILHEYGFKIAKK